MTCPADLPTPDTSKVEDLTYGDDSAGKPRGNLVKVATTTDTGGFDLTNTYDQLNRLTGSTSDETGTATTQAIAYDGLDRRVSDATTGGVTNTLTYLYDALAPEAISETNTHTGPDDRWLVEDPLGRLLGEVRDTDVRFNLHDNLGSTLATTDPSAASAATAVTANLAYGPYGQVRGEDGNAEAEAITYRFTGKRLDPVNHTTHHQARDYNPNMRSWVQTDQYLDPLMDLGLSTDLATSDRTLYAGGNPINMVDEDGHRITHGPGEIAKVQPLPPSAGGSGGGAFVLSGGARGRYASVGRAVSAHQSARARWISSGARAAYRAEQRRNNLRAKARRDAADRAADMRAQNVPTAESPPPAERTYSCIGLLNASCASMGMAVPGRAPEVRAGVMTPDEALRNAESWLKDGYYEDPNRNGRYISEDGRQIVRFGADEVRGPLHMHFETARNGSVNKNNRVEIRPRPPIVP